MEGDRELDLAKAIQIFAVAASEPVLQPTDDERSAFLLIRFSCVNSWAKLLSRSEEEGETAPPGDPTWKELTEAADKIMKTVCEELRRGDISKDRADPRLRDLARGVAARLKAGLSLLDLHRNTDASEVAFRSDEATPSVIVSYDEFERAIARAAAAREHDVVATARVYADDAFAHGTAPTVEELAGLRGTSTEAVESHLRRFTRFLPRALRVVPTATSDNIASNQPRELRFSHFPGSTETTIELDVFDAAIAICEGAGKVAVANAARVYRDLALELRGHPPSDDDVAASLAVKVQTARRYLRTFAKFLPPLGKRGGHLDPRSDQ